MADLHNHSCLSPCGGLEMSPRAMAARARELGIDILALTDHNTALNCPAMAAACAREGLTFIPGVEAQPREEVHVLCLFPMLEAALAFGEAASKLLGAFPNDPERLGDQVWVDDDEVIQGSVAPYLGQSIDVDLDGLCAMVLKQGGILVPAHIDRRSASMKSILGFLPEGPWTAVEARNLPPAGIDPLGYPVIIASDAHHMADMGRRRVSVELPDTWPSMDGGERFEALKRSLGGPSLELHFGA